MNKIYTLYTLFVFGSYGLINLALVESAFPKCEDILQTVDGKSSCWYCATDRVSQECKDQCISSGCSKDSSSDSSSSKTSSNSESNSVSNNDNGNSASASASSTGQSSKDGSDNTSAQSIKKSKGKGKSARGKKPKKAKAAKASSTKDSSSSSSSSSNSGSSGSSNSGSSGSSNSGSSGSSNSGSSGSSNSGSSGSSNSESSGSSGSSGASGQCNKVDPCVPLEESNKKFRECCVQKNLGESCYDACRYDITKKELVQKFTSKQCDLAQSRDLLYCMADNKDNTFCCSKTNLLDGDLQICEPFCNPASNDWPTKASAKYLKCLSEVEAIVHCHWAGRTP